MINRNLKEVYESEVAVITIGVVDMKDGSHLLQFLDPSKYQVIRAEAWIGNSKLQTNFDLFFQSTYVIGKHDHDSQDVDTIIEMLKIYAPERIFGQKLLTKPMESLILNKIGIPTPRIQALVIGEGAFHNGNNYRLFSTIQKNHRITDGPNLLCKPNYGAHADSQQVVELIDAHNIERWKHPTNEEGKPVDKAGKLLDPNKTIEKLSAYNYHFCEMIDITREYRVVIGIDGSYHVHTRFKDNPEVSVKELQEDRDDQWWVAKADGGEGFANDDILKKFEEEILPKMLKLMRTGLDRPTPCFSTDLYVDAQGNMGIIEFQGQFGIRKYKNLKIVDIVTGSIDYILKGILENVVTYPLVTDRSNLN